MNPSQSGQEGIKKALEGAKSYGMHTFERAMRNYILELHPVPNPKSKRERQLGALITPDALTCSGPGPLAVRDDGSSRLGTIAEWRDGAAPGHGQWYAKS